MSGHFLVTEFQVSLQVMHPGIKRQGIGGCHTHFEKVVAAHQDEQGAAGHSAGDELRAKCDDDNHERIYALTDQSTAVVAQPQVFTVGETLPKME